MDVVACSRLIVPAVASQRMSSVSEKLKSQIQTES